MDVLGVLDKGEPDSFGVVVNCPAQALGHVDLGEVRVDLPPDGAVLVDGPLPVMVTSCASRTLMSEAGQVSSMPAMRVGSSGKSLMSCDPVMVTPSGISNVTPDLRKSAPVT